MANANTSKKSAFEILNNINVNEHTEKKNGLTYLSWAWAWAEVKKAFPDANYTIYENADGWNYFTDGRSCWVKTGVTIEGMEHIEYLPVMDFKNKSIPANAVTSFDVNKAIQRSLTKACARHGLGLYIYAGEDLPSDTSTEAPAPAPSQKKPVAKKAQPICQRCGNPVCDTNGYTAMQIIASTQNQFKQDLCFTCAGIVKREKEAQKAQEEDEALQLPFPINE